MKLQKNKLCAFAFALLMISSAFFVFSNTNTTTAQAQKTSIPSNLLQYEWPVPAAAPQCTFFSAGPGPNSPSIQWKTKIPYVQGTMVAFNGLVFVSDFAKTYALDGGTGNIVWTAPLTGAVVKIDDTYMVIGSTCVRTADGSTVWTGPAGFVGYSGFFSGVSYVPELKMFLSGTDGWSLPDPSKPPTLLWNRTSDADGGTGIAAYYGDGKVFTGGGDGFIHAIDAKTGNAIWKTAALDVFGITYGASYYNGMLIQGDLANNMHAWDAKTGNLLWTYNPGTFYGQWASGTAVAYGMVYEHNQDTYMYAINATNGHLVWRAKGPGIGYSNLCSVADGKVYIQMGENEYRDPQTGVYGNSEYDCFDAYTGKLLWTLPMENGAPGNSQCVAYGNLYVIPTMSVGVPGTWVYTMTSLGVGGLGEVWCIGSKTNDWPMFLSDPAHTAEGAGPTNLALKWKFPTGAQIYSNPTAANGVVYFGSLDSNVYAVDANSGSKIWAFKTGFTVRSSPAVVNGKLYTGADDGNIYCLGATTGTQVWKTSAGGVTFSLLGGGLVNIRSSPTVVNGKVYVGALDGNLYCLDANSGTVLWKFQTGGQIHATAAVDNSGVYIPSSTQPLSGTLYKLDLNSGSVIWKLSLPYNLTATPGQGNILFASPTLANGMVFMRDCFHNNYALNATTGKQIWNYVAMSNPGTAFQSGGVDQIGTLLYAYGEIFLNDFYSISALNAADGTRVWTTYLSREDVSGGITYAYGRVYVVTEARVVYVLDALTGAKLSYYDTGGQMRSCPTPYNGNLYVGCCDWNLYCFGEARLMSAANASPSPAASPSSIASPAPTASPAVSPSILPTQTPSPAPSSEAASTTAYIAVAAVAVIIVIAAAALMLRRRK